MKSEDDPLDPAPRRGQTETFAAIRHVETAMSSLGDLKGAALRYGAFYGPDTGLFEPDMVRQLKRRAVPLIGGGGGWWSHIHIDDAASTTVAAIEGDAAGVFNVVDDEPAPVRKWLPALAEAVGARPPRRLPACIARLLAGDALVAMMTQARAGSNAKIKREFSWAAATPSWRQGFREVGVAADAYAKHGELEAPKMTRSIPTVDVEARRALDGAARVIAAVRYCWLVAEGENGAVTARPMGRVSPHPQKTDWSMSFVTDGRSRKAAEIRRSSKATLVFQGDGRGRLCSADRIGAAVRKPR